MMASPTIDDAIAGYLAHVSVERGLARNTVAAYTRDLARYSRWCQSLGLERIDSIQAGNVADFAASLRNPVGAGLQGESALSASSAARVIVAVRSFHRFADLEGWTSGDPAAETAPPSVPRRLPKALAYVSIEQMIDMLVDMGYSAEGLSNDEIYDMLVSVMDGHEDECGDIEELSFD